MASRRYSTYFPILFLLADLLCLNSGIILANQLRFGSYLIVDDAYYSLQLLLNGLWVLVFFSAGLHEIHREQRLLDHLNKVLTALVINLAVVFALWFATKPYYYSRQHLFYTYFLFTIALIFWRSSWHYFIRYYRARGFNIRNVVIVGFGDMAQEMIYFIKSNKALGYKMVGVFDDEACEDKLGQTDEVEEYIQNNHVDIMFCVLNRLDEPRVNDLINFAESNLIKVKIISQFSRLGNQNLSLQNYGPIPVLNVNAIPLDNKINQMTKRLFDVLFSGLFIVFVLSWLMPIVGLMIKLESKGPVFFKQLRHGRGNKPFLCW
ncbi:MAG: putative colanic acid biosynthesis UDP-glucose lipid carrier transferase, partial [Parvicella sp.]